MKYMKTVLRDITIGVDDVVAGFRDLKLKKAGSQKDSDDFDQVTSRDMSSYLR